MLRGIVYSFIGFCVFLLLAIGAVLLGLIGVEWADFAGGWLLMAALFLVGPLCFGLGYWHHLRLYPKAPHWDPETGE